MNFKIIDKAQFDRLKSEAGVQIIDVREEYEFEDQNLGGMNIPMAEVLSNLEKINCHETVLLCCQSGKRSKAIAYHLTQKCPDLTIYSLEGGIKAYFGIS